MNYQINNDRKQITPSENSRQSFIHSSFLESPRPKIKKHLHFEDDDERMVLYTSKWYIFF